MSDEIDRMLQNIAFHSMGIVPLVDLDHDVKKSLETLPADEARKMRRKFRKQWRKQACGDDVWQASMLGLGQKFPSARDKKHRKIQVLVHVQNRVVRSMKRAMKDAENGNDV